MTNIKQLFYFCTIVCVRVGSWRVFQPTVSWVMCPLETTQVEKKPLDSDYMLQLPSLQEK